MSVRQKDSRISSSGGGGGGSGNVAGPASSVDNEVVLYSGVTGKIIKNSKFTATDETDGPSLNALGTGSDALIRLRPKGKGFLRLGPDTYGLSGWTGNDIIAEVRRLATTLPYVYEFYIESTLGDVFDSYAYGLYSTIRSKGSGATQNIDVIIGGHFDAASYLQSGRQCNKIYALDLSTYASGGGLVDATYGVYGITDVTNGSQINTAYGIYWIFNDISTTDNTGKGYIFYGDLNTSKTMAELYGLWLKDFTNKSPLPYYLWFDSPGVRRIRAESDGNVTDAWYNPNFTKYTPGAANYERLSIGKWTSDVVEIGTEKGGTGTLRPVKLIGEFIQLGPDTFGLAGWSGYNIRLELIRLASTEASVIESDIESYLGDFLLGSIFGQYINVGTKSTGATQNVNAVQGFNSTANSYLPVGKTTSYVRGGGSQAYVSNGGRATHAIGLAAYVAASQASIIDEAIVIQAGMANYDGALDTISKAYGIKFDLETATMVMPEFYLLWGNDIAGKATSSSYVWFDSPGVYRITDAGKLNYHNPGFTKYTPGLANYERLVNQWNSNVAEIGTEAGGTGTLRNTRLIGKEIVERIGSSTSDMTFIGVANIQTSSGGIGNGADTTDDTLFTYTLPINSMSVNGKSVRVKASGHFATNANTKRVKLWFAGTAVSDSGVLTLSNTDWLIDMEVTRIDSTHVSCVGTFAGSNVAAIITVTANLAVSDLTANTSIIKVTGASTVTGAANDVLGYLMKTWFEN